MGGAAGVKKLVWTLLGKQETRRGGGTYSRLCRLWFTFRASAKATEPLSPTELLESLRHKRKSRRYQQPRCNQLRSASKRFISPRLFLLQQ